MKSIYVPRKLEIPTLSFLSQFAFVLSKRLIMRKRNIIVTNRGCKAEKIRI